MRNRHVHLLNIQCPLPFTKLKDHRQRIPRFVIRRFRKINTEETFLPFTIITDKDYFPRKKTIINSISENLLSLFIYGRDVIDANCVEQRRPENRKK